MKFLHIVLDTDSLQLPPSLTPDQAALFSPEARAFLVDLCRELGPAVNQLLAARRAAQARLDAGETLRFLPETRSIRESAWTVAPIPPDLRRRHVEITGPVDRKMVINALNSGADVFMADFEDATSPTLANLLDGQVNLRDAVTRTIRYVDGAKNRTYALGEHPATLLVRPRGWHLQERHVTLDGEPIPGALLDFGLYFFHNARPLLERGSGPYFYLPKLQHHREARLWNDVFNHAQDALGIPRGSIRATVLIETLPAAFQMDEILWELRDHAAGLNCGRWDYIFSFIKTLRARPDAVLPDRAQVGMTQPFMRAYTQLVIQTCHRRGIHAIGGMAAQIPIKADPEANARALDGVRADKLREVRDGHDGTWVAHPGLVGVAREVFTAGMEGDHQIQRLREDVSVGAEQLTAVPGGTRTEEGLRLNVRVGIQYLAAWLGGQGCVPLYNLMEDAATAEISRAQVWQWQHHGAALDDGRVVTRALIEEITADELRQLLDQESPAATSPALLVRARDLFLELATARELTEFLTLPAYDQLLQLQPKSSTPNPKNP